MAKNAETNDRMISTEEAAKEYKAGRAIVLVDDEDRENEVDIAFPAEFVTTELVNFMATEARGLICVPMTNARADELNLPLMTEHNTAPLGTAFTISVEAASGVTTGISAADRARTIEVLGAPTTESSDLTRPGHIFPLRAKDGGVLVRAGQTEASVDQCKIAGVEPVAVVCEIMNADGTMARMPDLEIFADQHDLKIASVADVIRYRMRTETLVARVGEATIPTEFGDFTAIGYSTQIDKREHVALVFGDIEPDQPTLARVHDKCVTGDAFGSLRCDCGEQLRGSLRIFSEAGGGVLLYLAQEGRGIGLANKLRAYNLQQEGFDTVDADCTLGFGADERGYNSAVEMLRHLKIDRICLLTNNPEKVRAVREGGIQVVDRQPLFGTLNRHNFPYVKAKIQRAGHWLGEMISGAVPGK